MKENLISFDECGDLFESSMRQNNQKNTQERRMEFYEG